MEMSCDSGKVEEAGVSEVSFELSESEPDLDREYLSHGGSRKGKYNKHKWELFSSWKGIGKKQAYRLAAKVMIHDFNTAGVLAFKQWPGPTDEKIGPFVRKSVRIGGF